MSIIITDEKGCLKTGLRADILRQSLETKNLLSTKGALYVGTGETVGVSSKDGGVRLCKTGVLLPGTNNSALIALMGEGYDYRSRGIQYGVIRPAAVEEGITCDIESYRAEKATHAEQAGTAEWATYIKDTNINIEETLSNFNHHDFVNGAVIPLFSSIQQVGTAQVTQGYREGNFVSFLLNISLNDKNNTYIKSFYENGGEIWGSGLLDGTGILDFMIDPHNNSNNNVSISGFFPSGLATYINIPDDISAGQHFALRYYIGVGTGTGGSHSSVFSIYLDHPLSFRNFNRIDSTSISIKVCFRMPEL